MKIARVGTEQNQATSRLTDGAANAEDVAQATATIDPFVSTAKIAKFCIGCQVGLSPVKFEGISSKGLRRKKVPIGIGKSCPTSILPTSSASRRRVSALEVTLPGSVMVARVTLNHLVKVRILSGQLP